MTTSMIIDDAVTGLEQRLAEATATVTVVGAGYVGLPLALALTARGYRVWAHDVDQRRVASLNAGRSYIRDIPERAIQEGLATSRFGATGDPSIITASDAIFVCVPTPFTPQKEPDLSCILSATRTIASRLRPGHLVIVRSTSFPGTTEEVVRPIDAKEDLAALFAEASWNDVSSRPALAALQMSSPQLIRARFTRSAVQLDVGKSCVRVFGAVSATRITGYAGAAQQARVMDTAPGRVPQDVRRLGQVK